MLDVKSLVKYLLGGVIVAAAAHYIPQKPASLREIGMIALSAVVVFAVLDLFTPTVLGQPSQSPSPSTNVASGLEAKEVSGSVPEPKPESESESDDEVSPNPMDSGNFSSVL
jgi:hypothetical protein